MHKTLILAVLVLTAFNGFGQSYTYHSDHPFGINTSPADTTKVPFVIAFVDRDRDLDLDLFIVGIEVESEISNFFDLTYFIDYQENIGDRTNPQFSNPEPAFDDFDFPNGLFFPSFKDINGDGYYDIVAQGQVDSFNYVQHLLIYMNQGISGVESFDVIIGDSMHIRPMLPFSFFFPEIVDLDSDGDHDILLSGMINLDTAATGYMAELIYALNIGTADSPDFQSWYYNPYALMTDSSFTRRKGCDIDNDGDTDIWRSVELESAVTMQFQQNIPDSTDRPNFIAPVLSPFGLPMWSDDIALQDFAFVDLDGDGDLDYSALINTDTGHIIQYYENDQCALNASVSINGQVLTADPTGAGYQWFDCGTLIQISGANQSTFSPDGSGTYAVIVTDTAGCSVMSDCFEFISTSISPTDISNQIILYPNPAGTQVQIFNNTGQTATRIVLYDLNGSIRLHTPTEQNTINLPELSDGIYYIRVQLGEISVYKKLLIIHP